MVQAIGAGFDLDLYHDDEKSFIYWVLAVLAEEQVSIACLCLSSPFMSCYSSTASAIMHLAQAHALVFLEVRGDRCARAQATVSRRLKWLHRPAWCDKPRLRLVTGKEPQDARALWDEWCVFANRMRVRLFLAHESVRAKNRGVSAPKYCSTWTHVWPLPALLWNSRRRIHRRVCAVELVTLSSAIFSRLQRRSCLSCKPPPGYRSRGCLRLVAGLYYRRVYRWTTIRRRVWLSFCFSRAIRSASQRARPQLQAPSSTRLPIPNACTRLMA